jgi:Tfp pilus assembly protein PilF
MSRLAIVTYLLIFTGLGLFGYTKVQSFRIEKNEAQLTQFSQTLEGKSAPDLVKIGTDLLKEGKTDEAEVALKKATELDRNYRDAFYYYAAAAAQEGKVKESLRAAVRAANLDPLFTPAKDLVEKVKEKIGK